MAAYTAADVKALREKTAAGMLDCKNALVEADGDFDKAVELLRVKGLKGVTKREGRIASNGLVASHVDGGVGVLLEVNCETDFVAKSEPFKQLAQRLLDQAVAVKSADVDALLTSELDGRAVKDVLDEANATLGEKIEIRRVAVLEGARVASYLHRTASDLPPTIGVLVAVDADSDDAAATGRDIAMHAAAMSPFYLTREEVPADLIATERRVAEDKAREEGKPDAALPKIVEGRVNSFFKDNVLLEQSYAKDPKQTVSKVLAAAGTTITAFARFRVGA